MSTNEKILLNYKNEDIDNKGANEKVEDFQGSVYQLVEELNRDKQGVVYKTQIPNIIIKIELENGNLKRNIGDESSKFEDIRYLPFPKNEEFGVAMPVKILKDYSGYVVYLSDEMKSFNEYFEKSSKLKPIRLTKWLESMDEKVADFVENISTYLLAYNEEIKKELYVGRRERIEAYLKVSCIFSKLHANGLVYGDTSFNNFFYSRFNDKATVYLINPDSINFQYITETKKLYTPGFAVPEVIQGKSGRTMYADVYSFATALFWELTWSHPFRGKLAKENSCKDAGELPWILDMEDKSNAIDPNTTIPHQLIINPSLMELFQRTFSAKGKVNPTKRPSMFEWSYELAKTLDRSVRCENCEMDFDYDEYESKCPWCDTKNKVIRITSYKDQSKTNTIWEYVHEISPLDVNLRIIHDFKVLEEGEKLFSVFKDDDLVIKSFNKKFDFYIGDKKLYGEYVISDNLFIECRDKNKKSIWIEVKI